MDDLVSHLSQSFFYLDMKYEENEKEIKHHENRLDTVMDRYKDILMQKNPINPKPSKRPMKAIQDGNEDEEEANSRIQKSPKNSSDRQSLRPLRNAKSKANANLKEPNLGSKLRNDNNQVVFTGTERTSINSSRRDSTKENSDPEPVRKSKSSENMRVKRSESVEILSVTKTVEIDITKDDDNDKMPPPLMPLAKTKSKKQKEKVKAPEETEILEANRITRSKIKQEKISIECPQGILQATSTTVTTVQETTMSSTSKEIVTAGKKKTKKYPMPILVKIEPEDVPKILERHSREEFTANETFDVKKTPEMNETVTISKAPAMNETVTIETNKENVQSEKNLHESLMTDDNDDEEMSEEIPLSMLQKPGKVEVPPKLPPKKKNEVFNPYVSSPIKQKIQAFEKHANQVATPEKFRALPLGTKYATLKAGTPSKIALFSSKTTPSTLTKNQKFVSTSVLTASAPGNGKFSKTSKKVPSTSQESLEESRKNFGSMPALSHQQQMEDRKRLREEKQRQAQILREQMEKEKRDQAIRAQLEKEEKRQKALREKEERQRQEILNKKMKKEAQIRKLNEEREREEAKKEMPPPLTGGVGPTSSASGPNDSLLMKMQKQKMAEKAKEDAKKVYGFDMLQTDDSTDDEGTPSTKRPPPPSWSKKSNRKHPMRMQNHVNPNVLDTLFSVQPLNVDLKAIFPSIDVRKLARNSSAVWNTPPRRNN